MHMPRDRHTTETSGGSWWTDSAHCALKLRASKPCSRRPMCDGFSRRHWPNVTIGWLKKFDGWLAG